MGQVFTPNAELQHLAGRRIAEIPTTLTINGEERQLAIEPWTTLLDLLRDKLDPIGSKKGCGSWPVRCVHRADRRNAHERLPEACGDPRRLCDHDDRGPGSGRQPSIRSKPPLSSMTPSNAVIARRDRSAPLRP